MLKIDSDKQRFKVFISYPGTDGLIIAKKLRDILEQARHRPWFYPHHRTWGVSTFREISICITDRSDVFMYVCTSSSRASYGQELEAGFALDERRVKPLVLVINGARIPPELRGRNHENLSMNDLERRLQVIVRNLPDTVRRIRRLEPDVRTKPTQKEQLD